MVPLLLIQLGYPTAPPGTGGADPKIVLGAKESTSVTNTPTIGGGWGR